MLTRHFYRLDEVRAALAYDIGRGRPVEAAFWCQELIESEAIQLAWATVVETWLWQVLVLDPAFLADVFKSFHDIDADADGDAVHLAVYRLAMTCREYRDNSLWALLVLGTKDETVPDRLCLRCPAESVSYRSALERYLGLALFQGKALCAWWALTQIGFGEARRFLPPSPLPAILEVVGLTGPEWIPIGICAQILLTVTATVVTVKPFTTRYTSLPDYIVASRDQWQSCKGRRSRRIYSIPKECLYGQTTRGALSHTATTMGDLYRIEPSLQESPFWQSRFHPQDDDELEAFYQTYFPDDIPDEWSSADREKSHGPGVLRPSQTLTLAALGRIWMTAESRYAWSFYEWSPSVELELELDAGCLLKHSDIGQLYAEQNKSTVIDALLEPIRKMVIAE